MILIHGMSLHHLGWETNFNSPNLVQDTWIHKTLLGNVSPLT